MPIKFTEDWYQNLPVLSQKLAAQLFKISPSCRYDKNWFPCSVKLNNGDIIERVYLVDAAGYREIGWIDDEKDFYPMEEVVEINESRYRLPYWIWKILEDAGETAMGYLAFTLEFSDGSSSIYASEGYFLDFFEMPEGKTEADILQIIPHHPRESKEKRLHDAGFGFIHYRR